MAKLTLKKAKEELDKLDSLEAKQKYLEKILAKTKDKKLIKELEKLLEEIKELLKEKVKPEVTLEKRFRTPVPEFAGVPDDPKLATSAPTKSKIESLLEKYTHPKSTPEQEKLLEPIKATDIYRTKIDYISEANRDSIQDIVQKYLRAEGMHAEDFARSPQLQRKAAEKAYELLGRTVDLYAVEKQVEYDVWKSAHPGWEWERDAEGFIKYKSVRRIKPELEET